MVAMSATVPEAVPAAAAAAAVPAAAAAVSRWQAPNLSESL